jgi:TonB family protein
MEEAARGAVMTPRRIEGLAVALVTVAACGGGDANTGRTPAPPAEEPPVALNADVPIAYPPGLYDRNVDGEVLLRLYVDTAGKLVPESTRVAESSGYAAFDSAAVAGAPHLTFAPAKRHGLPVATAFVQPVEFRHPQVDAAGPAAPAASTPAPVPIRLEPRPAAPPPVHRVRASRPRADTTAVDSAKRDTTKRDSTKRDTTPPDTTKAKRDSNAVAH